LAKAQDVDQWYEVDVAEPIFFAEILRELPGARLFDCCAGAIAKPVKIDDTKINGILGKIGRVPINFIRC